jgi:hypothetical protein
MVDVTSIGGLPAIGQGSTLGIWEWRQDGIYFLGATQDMQIRLRYQKSFPDFTDGSSVVLIRNAQEVIAYSGAAMAALARGSPLAESWDKAAQNALEDLIITSVRRDQRIARRRLPFSARGRR